MRRPIHIRFSGIESSNALIAAAQSHAYGLAWTESEIIACWIGIRLNPWRTGQRPTYSVRIDVSVPGHELIAQRVEHEDVHLALGHAFDDMARQLAGINARVHHAQYAVTVPGMLLTPEDLAGERRYGDRRTEARRTTVP